MKLGNTMQNGLACHHFKLSKIYPLGLDIWYFLNSIRNMHFRSEMKKKKAEIKKAENLLNVERKKVLKSVPVVLCTLTGCKSKVGHLTDNLPFNFLFF